MSYLRFVLQLLSVAILLSQIEASAQQRCESLFQPQVVQIKPAAQILHERDSQLHMSKLVQKAVSQHEKKAGVTLIKPADKINQWLEHLIKISNRAESSPRILEQLKSILRDQFVIKFENVPESYYALQAKIDRERGHGDTILTTDKKKQLASNVIADQKKSLELWIEYLVSKDTYMYPMWIKYWMFTGMTKLSKYNITNGQFGNRDKTTVAPFVELNREALALVVEYVLKYTNKKSLEDINDPELMTLLSGLNFGKLYGHILFKLGVGREGAFKTNQGKWVVYAKGSDHGPLVKSLEGKNSGWCVAGESTAASALRKGDFHVYYSFDEKGQATIPRVAIRMEDANIAEVRGVAANQNLDSQINRSSIVSGKMQEFGARADQYFKKVQDMKLLTEIEDKQSRNVQLTKDEIIFLYEVNERIQGFGYERDPRIEKIKSMRDLKSDIIFAYGDKYNRDEITTTLEEFMSGKSKIHFGNLQLMGLTSAEGLKLPDKLIGDLDLRGLTSVEGLTLPHTISGDFNLSGLTSAKGLTLPQTIRGGLNLMGLTSAEGLKLPGSVGGSLYLSRLTSAKELILPHTIGGGLNLMGLTSAEGLTLPHTIGGDLYLSGLTSAKGLKLPGVVGGELHLSGLTSAEGLKLPDIINGNLDLSGLTSAEGLKLPETINKNLDLRGLTSAIGLKLPNTTGGDLFLSGLTSAVGLKLPDTIRGSLHLSGLTSAEGLKLPDTVNKYLDLRGLTSAIGLKLPAGVRVYFGPKDIQR